MGDALVQRGSMNFVRPAVEFRFDALGPSIEERAYQPTDQLYCQHTPWACGENNAEDREQLVLENLPRSVRSDCRCPSCANETNVQERRGDHNDKTGFIDPTQGVELPVDP